MACFDAPLKAEDINIRDPFILLDGDVYYMYGSDGKTFGMRTGGFWVWKSADLAHWSAPAQIFDSARFGLNTAANWAPEVHKYKGRYYLCATFSRPDTEMRGTHILAADSPEGPFVPHSGGSVTPQDWWALDGTLHFEHGVPYMVFCHEHVQIGDGTVEYVRLSEDLTHPAAQPVTLFHATDVFGGCEAGRKSYVTDGPFLYRHANGALSMIWSTIKNGSYLQCVAVSDSGSVVGPWRQKPHLFEQDGGHGMIFRDKNGTLWLSLHSPNQSKLERPRFIELHEDGNEIRIMKH